MSFRLARPAALPISASSGDLLRHRRFASLSDLLSTTSWHLPSPFTPIHTISVSPDAGHFSFSKLPDEEEERNSSIARFHVARDDLLHPLANGNKARKLDALLPLLRACSATDVVSFFYLFFKFLIRVKHQPTEQNVQMLEGLSPF
jgi:hypothetical protein